jgi:ribonuclease HII
MQSTSPVIAGVDEAGRGAVAGPVVAGACILPSNVTVPEFIRDSKQLSPAARTDAFHWIERHCAFGWGVVPAECIDRSGILTATELAMQAAVRSLAMQKIPTYLLVDGQDHFWFDYPHSSIVRGDQTEKCIAAASIVAKVMRDQLMVRSHLEFPLYGFREHKGYGTPAHFSLIERFGACPLHRRTFITRVGAASPQPTQAAGRRRRVESSTIALV